MKVPTKSEYLSVISSKMNSEAIVRIMSLIIPIKV
jgi:hypothetical protein